jgi:hypothetical protein
MALPWAQLGSLTPGAQLFLPLQITTMTPSSITLAVLAVNPSTGLYDPTPSGSFTINLQTNQVSGQWSADPGGQPAWIRALPLTVGDLLQGSGGVVLRAAAVGLGPDGTWWSQFGDGRSPLSQDGYTVVGHLDLP